MTAATTLPPDAVRAGRRPLWRRNADFRALWAGDLISQTGSQVTLVVLPLLVVGTLHAGGAETGLLQACYTASFVVLPLLAGVWLEHRSRRPVLIAADVVRLTLLLAVPLLALLGTLRLWHVFLVAALGGAATVVHDIAASSYLPRLVEPADLPKANSALAANQAIGGTAGPGVAGWATGLFGPVGALVLDALSYLASATALILVRHREVPAPPAPRQPVRRQVAEGLRAVLGQPAIRGIVLHASVYNAGSSVLAVAFLLLFVRDLGHGGGQYGLVMAAGGVGASVGALATPALLTRLGVAPAFAVALTFSTLPYLLLAGSDGSAADLVRCGAAFFLGSAGAAGGSVIATTVRQRLTPDRLLARMTATYRLIAFGSIAVGSALAGLLVDAAGARAVLWAAPVLLLLSVPPALGRPVRALGRL